jgi:hypothetical protein
MGTSAKLTKRVRSPLDRVRMKDSERTAAQVSLEQGERIASFIVDATAAIGFVLRVVERGVRALTRAKTLN